MRWIVIAMLWTASTAGELRADERTPGVALAEGITEITGVAISPLLGVSAVGLWTYWRTPAGQRAELPWFCQPWAWGTGLTVLAMCLLKDTLGAAAPGVLKKPFDMAELFENKASALVASVGFVPLVAAEMSRAEPAEVPAEVPAGALGLDVTAVIDTSWLVTPLALVTFAVVWLCSHAVNVLIILSPFSLVDTLLKLARAAVLSAVAACYAIAPWLGAALCLAIIAVAAWLAPPALRLMIFGTRFAGDVLLPWRARRRVRPDQPHVFTLRKVAGLPARTGGRLARNEAGGLEFRYRPWCVRAERRIALPDAPRRLARGLFSPVLLDGGGADGAGGQRTMIFLPRYRRHEEEVVGRLGFDGVRDHAWARGWAALKGWWRDLFGSRAPAA